MPLPSLTVCGNRIVEQGSGTPVLLRGVNRSGLEYSSPDGEGSLAKAGITERELAHIVTDWKVNIVRLPLNQEWSLERLGYCPERYLEAIDFVVDTLSRLGAYTLLDLQWLDAHTPRGTVNGRPNFVAPLPNDKSVEMWQQLATRWRHNPAVLYDVFNEPHDPLADDQEATCSRVPWQEWHRWAGRLIEAIRSVHADALLFVSGLNWGYDLCSFPLAGMEGLVYSTHVYPSKGWHWGRAFGNLCVQAPVFAGEWGGGPDDLAWGRRLSAYFERHNIGWTAWSWSDHPFLVRRGSPSAPSPFGHLVRAALRRESYDITGETFFT